MGQVPTTVPFSSQLNLRALASLRPGHGPPRVKPRKGAVRERQKGWSPAKTALRTIEEELLKVGKMEGYRRHSPRVKPSEGTVRERQKGWSPAKTALCTNEEELLGAIHQG